MKRRILLIAILASMASAAMASDYGLSLSTAPRYFDSDVTFTTSVSPWYSTLIGDSGELYLSGIVDLAYEEEEWDSRLDLGRFQLTLRPRSGFRFDTGRFPYSDVSGFVIHGLFDGARFSYAYDRVNFMVGGFYTGFLNKERAEIVMSEADMTDSLNDDNYFAPRRALMTVAVEVPSIFRRLSASAEALGQFDLRDGDEVLHTQYLSMSLSGPIYPTLSFTSSLATGLAEAAGVNIATSLAFRTELSYYPVGGAADRAYLGFKWASGDGRSMGRFLPVKGLNAGTVFDVGLSGVAAFKGGYFARLMESFSMDISASLFLRQGAGVVDPELDPDSDTIYLGSEMYGEVVFAPTSELSMTGGAGLFFPSGAAFDSGAGVRPLLTASFIISF